MRCYALSIIIKFVNVSEELTASVFRAFPVEEDVDEYLSADKYWQLFVISSRSILAFKRILLAELLQRSWSYFKRKLCLILTVGGRYTLRIIQRLSK
jgi:hypothetical protein